MLRLLSFTALLAAASAQVTSDTYFYGQSPPVYPAPNMTGSGSWEDAYQKAQALVSKMSLTEKVAITAGTSSSTGCTGYVASVSAVGFPGLCLSDSGNGVRDTDFVSGFPSGNAVGASWNSDLAQKRAYAMGMEFRTKGSNIALGPVIGPIGRVVKGGRNWETIAADPYLTGILGADTVTGIQQAGVGASTKHFIGYEQETNRNPTGSAASYSSNIDDKTMHELYLWPFMDAVHAGTTNVMCSYNRVNNSYACQNSKMINGLLKTELGFQGFVVSDWDAQMSGVASALSGLDMMMPGPLLLWGTQLTTAVNNGSVPESRVDDMATRILAAWYQMGQDSNYPSPGVGLPFDLTEAHTIVDARNHSALPILLQGAIEGHVLVKNENNALPLKKPKMMSLFGYSATSPPEWDLDANMFNWPYGGESAELGMVYEDALFGENITVQVAWNGTLYGGAGSGANTPTQVVSPFAALNMRTYNDGTALMWDFVNESPYVDAASDVCIVFGNAFAAESYDRPGLDDTYTDTLITNVASKCANTIVVLHNMYTRLVDNFVDHENVTAIIFAHLPGQASGLALTQLLYGDVNFSGKLPYTVAKEETDYGALLNPGLPMGDFADFPQVTFFEGVYTDYRYFDKNDIEPRYEFGFGLSYTTFNYSDLQISQSGSNNGSFSTYPTGQIQQGGQSDLWDTVATVTATVTNSGSVSGAEAAQLYVGIPSGPVRQLRGFAKPTINAGSSTTVSFALTRRDLSVWDVVAQKWMLQSGEYTIYVGSSSRNLPLTGSLTL